MPQSLYIHITVLETYILKVNKCFYEIVINGLRCQLSYVTKGSIIAYMISENTT